MCAVSVTCLLRVLIGFGGYPYVLFPQGLVDTTSGPKGSQPRTRDSSHRRMKRDPSSVTLEIHTDVYTSGMALSIKNPEADRLARELATTTGESLTDAVVNALQERLDRARHQRAAGVAQRLRRLAAEVREIPVIDLRAADDIIGYDDDGLPT